MGNQNRKRALDLSVQGARLGGSVKLPEGATGVRVYGTGLPKAGVLLNRGEMESGVNAVIAEETPDWHRGYGGGMP